MKAQELFEQVTADLVAAIEAGASDWQMPWRRLGAGLPAQRRRPAVPRVERAGVGDGRRRRGWTSARWATYRGWQRHGCQVRRGERGTHVVLWKPTERHEPARRRRSTRVHRVAVRSHVHRVRGGASRRRRPLS